MGNKQTCAQTRDQLENPKRIKTEQSSSISLLQHTETKRKLHQYSCNPTRIHENFQLHRKALVRLLQISFSPHCKQRSFAIPPRHRRRALSLSLSPAPYGGKFKPEWGRVLGIAPPDPSGYQSWVSNSTNHRHPKIKYPDWYIPAVNETIKFPVITHHHGYYQGLKYPVVAHGFGSQICFEFFLFSRTKTNMFGFGKTLCCYFYFIFELQLLNSMASCCFCTLVFILFFNF